MAKKNQTPQAPDEMEVMLNKSEAFVNKYSKQLIAAVVAIIVVVLGYVGYQHMSASSQEEASTALAASQQQFQNGQYEEAVKGFIKVADEHSSTKAGNLAKLYAGLCYANLEKWNDAVKYLEGFSTKDDAMVSPAALFALGNAYANTKQLDKAVSTMKDAAAKADSEAKDGANTSLSPTFLLAAAEILMSQGKADEALEIYQDIKAKYINSMAYQEIDKYIERASASKK